jgi:hypothetical protein
MAVAEQAAMHKLLLLLLCAGCAAAPPDASSADHADTAGIAEGTRDAIGILRVANQAHLLELTDPAKGNLRLRAAEAIVAFRLGDDEIEGTADDGRFDTLAKLDAVPYVGPAEFLALLRFAKALGFVAPGAGPAPAAGSWLQVSTVGALSQAEPSMVWAGGEMFVTGYEGARRYHPASDSWAHLAPGDPYPTRPRSLAAMGDEVYVVGKNARGAEVAAIYSPKLDRWRPSQSWPPTTVRDNIWTGTELVLAERGSYLYDHHWVQLHRYDPRRDVWTSDKTMELVESTRVLAWTGQEILIWDGKRGLAFDPATRAWRRMSTASVPPRSYEGAAWTGSSFIVPGNHAAYDPAADRWTPISRLHAPVACCSRAVVWTGSRVIVSAVEENGSGAQDGAAYDPRTDSWTRLPPAPLSLYRPQAAWTGREVLLWGLLGVRSLDTAGLRFVP